MKIYIPPIGENWICDRIKSEFEEYNRDIVTGYMTDKTDLIWIVSPWLWRNYLDMIKGKKVLMTIHHIVPDKFDEKEFLERDKIVDYYHVPNDKTKEIVEKYTQKPVVKIGYWYDPKKWYRMGYNISRERLGISKTDFVIGSFQRDSEGSDPLKPKLEKGPDQLISMIKNFKDQIKNSKLDLHVLLGGYRRGYIISELEKLGVKYTYKELVDEKTLRQMYSSCNCYLITSRYEGGPQALLESLAMNVPVFSTRVGMAEDILPDYLLIDDVNNFYIPDKDTDTLIKVYDKVCKYNLENISEYYRLLFKKIIGE